MTRAQIASLIGETWVDLMMPAFQKPDENTPSMFEKIMAELRKQKGENAVILPEAPRVFEMFQKIKWPDVKVIVVNMAPWPYPNDATGVGLAVDRNDNFPSALQIFFDGIESSVYNGLNLNKSEYTGDLKMWIDQGVMFYNAALTTVAGDPKSHVDVWKDFTRLFFTQVNKNCRNILIIALGDVAREAIAPIIPFDHFPYTCEHPAAAGYQKRAWNHNHVFTNVAAAYLRIHHKELVW